MAEPQPQPESKGLLFKQSSELEILISAAIVFAIFSYLDVVKAFIIDMLNHNVTSNSLSILVAVLVALFLSQLLPISIVLHFILRFYWLSLVGLKATFDHPQLEKLNLAPRYLESIKRRSNLDRHVEFIDKLCSSIFAFSFLTVFVFCFTTVSIALIMGWLGYLVNVVFVDSWLAYVFNVLFAVFLVFCVLTLFDFFSLGLVKRIKKKWFVRMYYPISRFMGFVTLSFFYRGLYYTFISNIPRRIAIFVLPVYIALGVLLLNAGFHENRLYMDDASALKLGRKAAFASYYRENFTKMTEVQFPFTDGYYISEQYLPVFIPITEQIDGGIISNCDSVTPVNDGGFHWRKFIKLGSLNNPLPADFDYDTNAGRILDCLSAHVRLRIDDSTYHPQDFRFYVVQEPEKTTALTTLDISFLPKGDHVLQVEFLEPVYSGRIEIPFYKTSD